MEGPYQHSHAQLQLVGRRTHGEKTGQAKSLGV